jgi:serine/threonine-protein kinase
VRYVSPNPDGRRDRVARPVVAAPAPAPVKEPSEPEPLTIQRGDLTPIILEQGYVRSLTPAQREDLKLWHGRLTLLDRVKGFRWHSLWWLNLVFWAAVGLGVFVEEPEAFPLVLGPVVPAVMWRKLAARARSLREHGLRIRRVLFMPRAKWVIPAAPASDAQARENQLRKLAPREVLDGPTGIAIRRAVDDRAAIQEILKGLSKTDRAMLPDLGPTVDALVERVTNLAKMVDRLDEGIDPAVASEIDLRIDAIRAEPESTARDRRLAFLERQRSTLDEMIAQRDTLLAQLESAGLALATLRLDLVKLRTSGLPSALSDVSSATQEARALSSEIGAVLDAVAEARRL